MKITNDYIIDTIVKEFQNHIDTIYICSKEINVGNYSHFTDMEIYIVPSREFEEPSNFRQKLANLFFESETDEVSICANLYDGYLPEDWEVKVWKKN